MSHLWHGARGIPAVAEHGTACRLVAGVSSGAVGTLVALSTANPNCGSDHKPSHATLEPRMILERFSKRYSETTVAAVPDIVPELGWRREGARRR